jgi:uncharacterized protein with ParB-like and HNH nuclease domain
MNISEQIANERRLVSFDTYDISVQQLTNMVLAGQIDLAPAYQRLFRWNSQKQSQLVESIFLGIPVPDLFMATNKDETWEVVDGVQRLSTIVHFCGEHDARLKLGLADLLRIEGLEKLTALNGLIFDDIPEAIKTRFQLRPVKVTTLNDKSDKKVRFDLFERLNTGGVSLTAQEIRACVYRGRFSEFLRRLSQNNDFKAVVKLQKSKELDATREEYVLRFFAFFHRYKKFQHSVIGFLNDYMEMANKTFDYEKGEDIFNETFSRLHAILPGGISRGRNITPINLYEAVSVGAAIALQEKGALRSAPNLDWIASDELRRFTESGTNNLPMVVGRIELAARNFGA